jgi:hypothetical protein
MTSNPALLPCPFCGRQPIFDHFDNPRPQENMWGEKSPSRPWASYSCYGQDSPSIQICIGHTLARATEHGDTPEEARLKAAKTWNTRTALQAAQGWRDIKDAPRDGNEWAEMLAAWMVEHGFATGHGETMSGLLHELSWQVSERRGWMPIETAPISDHVLLCWKTASGTWQRSTGAAVWPSMFGNGMVHHPLATHWQPLPPPPVVEK